MIYPTGYNDPTVGSTVEMPVDQPLPDSAAVWPATIMSQYANSPRLLAMIEAFADSIDPTRLSDLFFDAIWNIDTAGELGLDIWGRIVNVRRTLFIPGGETGQTFGFAEPHSPQYSGFGQFTFNTLNTLTPNYVLKDDDYRRLILVKAFSNISDCSIPSMNAALMRLFAGQGSVYVADAGDMRASFIFTFTPSALDIAILTQSGAFATPSGVLFNVGTFFQGSTFGFAEQGSAVATFANGTFNH